MAKIKIKSLSLKDFKGIHTLDIQFGEEQTKIFGDNATGKTTIFDAFTWLLFGKDSKDRKDFQIKPLNSEGKTTDKTETEVSAVLDINGNETTVRRVLSEKWTKKRGSEVSEFTGNETKYFWNDVPFSAGEFDSQIKQFVNESVFKLVTNTERFASLNWKEQRDVLFDIAGVKADNELISEFDSSSVLISVLEAGKSLDQYKKEIASKKKIIKDEIEQIPARISELQRIKPEVEFSKAGLESGISEIQFNISTSNKFITDENARIAKANEEINSAIRKNNEEINQFRIDLQNYVSEKQLELNTEVFKLRNRKQFLNSEVDRISLNVKEFSEMISKKTSRINKLSEEKDSLVSSWKTINESQFVEPAQEENCITCGQPVKHEIDIEGYRTKFNDLKINRLKEIEGFGLNVKNQIEALESDLKIIQNRKHTEETLLQETKADFDALVVPEQVSFAGDEKSKFYEEEIARLEAIKFEPVSDADKLNNLKLQKTSFEADLQGAQKELAKYDEIERIDKRIQELEERETILASELAGFEKQEFEIEKFNRFKIDAIEKTINSMFKFVKFKMFNTLINGGTEETCEALIFGVPYSDANNASRINAGLDIIDVLSKYYDIEAPCFIDNAESVTRFTTFSNQLILLIVNEECKKLLVR